MRKWRRSMLKGRRVVLKMLSHPCYVCGQSCAGAGTPESFECRLTFDWRESHPILARILLP